MPWQFTGIVPSAIVVPIIAVAVVRKVNIEAWVVVEAFVTYAVVENDVDVCAPDPECWVCLIRHVGRSR
jgi:hypothetical protein